MGALIVVLIGAAPAHAQFYSEITPGAANVAASTSDINVPGNTVDNNLGTRWSGSGDGAWIRYDLGNARQINVVKIAFYRGNERRYRFDLQTSNDNVTWTNLIASGQSSGTTTAEETFDVPDRVARYLRYVGHGSTVNTWNSLTEVSIFQVVCPTPTAPPPPPAPNGVTAVPGNGSVVIRWNSYPDVRYEVGRSTTSGGPYQSIAMVTARVSDTTSHTDTAVSNGTRYYYVVRRWMDWTYGAPPCPVNSYSQPSAWSVEVSAVPDGGIQVPTPTPTPTPTPATAPIVEITPAGAQVAASTNDGNLPANTVDNNLSTRWSGYGNAWIRFDLGVSRTVSHVRIAVYRGNERRNRFDLQASEDGINWTTLRAGVESSGTTTAEETYDFPDAQGRYLRYLGSGSDVGPWNSVSEVSVFGR